MSKDKRDHHCVDCRGNGSHYVTENCYVCDLNRQLAESQAEIERLKEQRRHKDARFDEIVTENEHLTARLAEAEGLLGGATAYIPTDTDTWTHPLRHKITAFLANQTEKKEGS